MPCFCLISDQDDYNQIPSRVSPITALGRKRTFVNVRKRPKADINQGVARLTAPLTLSITRGRALRESPDSRQFDTMATKRKNRREAL